MAFFKKPIGAFLVSLALVLVATLVTVNVKLGNRCQDVTDGFYTGVLYNGTEEESISDQLDSLLILADELEIVAEKYDVDVEPLSYAREDMQFGIMYSHNDISYLYYTYDELITSMRQLFDALSTAGMSQDDARTVQGIKDAASSAQEVIRQSDYNESVREYLLKYERFPTYIMGEFANVDKPQYFS